METVYMRKTVSCSISDETYDEVAREASRRGITVSELMRYYVEQGLNNPTPQELRRLYDRFSTIEGGLKELYAMAVVNWAQVRTEKRKPAQLTPLPWMPGAWDNWKEQLAKKGLLNTKTGETAYEALTEGTPKESPDLFDDYELTDKQTREYLRETWKADGTWTEEEEAEYQQDVKKKIVSKPKTAARKSKTTKRKPK